MATLKVPVVLIPRALHRLDRTSASWPAPQEACRMRAQTGAAQLMLQTAKECLQGRQGQR